MKFNLLIVFLVSTFSINAHDNSKIETEIISLKQTASKAI